MKKALIVLACVWGFVLGAKDEEKKARKAPPKPVKIEKAKLVKTRPMTKVIGTTYFERVSEIATEVSGVVEKVYFEEGDRVKKGDLLVELNTEILEQQIKAQEAVLDITSIRHEQSKSRLKRVNNLHEKKAVSTDTYEEAYFGEKALVAEVKSQETVLGELKIKLRKSKIHAPFDGLVLKKSIEKGAWAGSSDELLTLADTGSLYLQVPVFEKALQFLKADDSFEALVNATGKKYNCDYMGIRPRADEVTKNIYLRLKLPSNGLLVPNMSADIMVPDAKPEKQLMVPRSAIVNFMGREMVFVVKKGKAEAVSVKVLFYSGESVAISGKKLSEGMSVIVEGNERLQPGAKVKEVD